MTPDGTAELIESLRGEIADIIAESSIRYYDDGPLSKSDALEWADDIIDLLTERLASAVNED